MKQMMLWSVLAWTATGMVAGTATAQTHPAGSGLSVGKLTCEYMSNPLGIDVRQPRLSWIVQSSERGAKQTAYQIVAADTIADIEQDKGNLWDTGKVSSDQTLHLVYAGKPMTTGLRAYWKVRVWDGNDQASAWSETAWWEMGLLNDTDWKAQWIAADADKQDVLAPFKTDQMKWFWFPEADPSNPPKEMPHYFRTTFELSTVAEARLLFTVDETFVLYVNGQEVSRGAEWPMLKVIDLSKHLASGKNMLAIEAVNLGGAAGVIGQLATRTGQTWTPYDPQWKCTDQKTENWQNIGFDDHSWKSAVKMGDFGGQPWGTLYYDAPAQPAPHFRKTFQLDKPIALARVYVCGLGYHEVYLNGGKVGDHVLDPGYTAYDQRVLYVTHDVTEQVRNGQNAIGVILGNGWYNMHARATWNFYQASWRDVPRLLLKLYVRYEDGSETVLGSDETWKVARGPIEYDCIRVGEVYDARKELSGWAMPGYDDASWPSAKRVHAPGGVVVAQNGTPVKVVKSLKPAKLKEAKPGVFVYDLGQSIAGWGRLTVTGPAGTQVRMKYGERLNPDGTINQDRINQHSHEKTFQCDTYTLKGDGQETYEPRFVYHGFQYVEITGYPGTPTLDNLQGRVVHTAFEQVGTFECSNEIFNKLQQATIWSYGANFVSIPTDCPHREKNGWTGDAHMAARQAMYNFQNAAAYTKWVNDLRDAQKPDGALPGIVPTGGWGFVWGNGPAWDSVYLLIPWYLYQYCGDTRLLESNYEQHRLYVDYMTSKATDHIVSFGLGDWVPLEEKTPEAITSTGYYYQDATIVARVAKMLGKEDDHRKYSKLADAIKQSFNAKFVDHSTGKVDGGTQTAQSCALHQELAEPADVEKIVNTLVADIREHHDHINSGVLGACYILRALTDNGRPDVAYTVASQTTFPGWGYWIAQGATTLWEDWNGGESLNHIFFGDISAWFYQALAGITVDPEQVAFKHIIIRPYVLGDLTWARAEYNSVRGKIVSGWKLDGDTLKLDLVIPANTTATVYLPCTDADKVTESGTPVTQAKSVKFVGVKNGRPTYEVPAGTYQFSGTLLRDK